MSATLSGVEESIHEKLMAKLAPEMESAEPVSDEIEEETEELEADASDEVEVTEEDVEESVEAESSEDEAQDAEPSESQEIELSHIAEYLGANEDQFIVSDDGELLVRTKIDGEEGQAKFADILKSYQLEGHLNKQSTDLAETKKALQSKLAEADSKLAEKVQQLEDLSQIAYNELLSDYNNVNWNELRADDPGEYAARMADFQNRQSQIADLYQKAQDRRGELSATGDIDLAEKAREEGQKLLEAIPEWNNPDSYKKGWADVTNYAQSQGYSDSEVNSTIDHRLFVLLDKAMKFDSLQKEKQAVTHRVRKAPKIAKPGSTAQKVPNKTLEAQKLKQQLKRDGGGKALHEILLSRV